MSRNEAAREVLQPKSRRVKARTVCVQALCGPRIQHGWPPLPQIGERDLRALCAGRAPGCERRGGAGGTARQSRHGSRIRNAIRTNVATSPASAFLSQVAQICNASADRQADIFATDGLGCSKEWSGKHLYSSVVHSSVRKLTSGMFLLMKNFHSGDDCLK